MWINKIMFQALRSHRHFVNWRGCSRGGGKSGGVLDVWCFIRTHHIPLALSHPLPKKRGRHPWHPAGADGIPVWWEDPLLKPSDAWHSHTHTHTNYICGSSVQAFPRAALSLYTRVWLFKCTTHIKQFYGLDHSLINICLPLIGQFTWTLIISL